MREDHLRGLLALLPHVLDVKYAGDRLVTNCVVAPIKHEGGVDRHPSMTITYDEGASFCFCHACGWMGTIEDAFGFLSQRLSRSDHLRSTVGALHLRVADLEKLDFPNLERSMAKRKQPPVREHTKLWSKLVQHRWSQAAIDLCAAKNVDPEYARTKFGVAFIPEGTEDFAFGRDEFGDPKELHQDVLAFPSLIRREGRLTCIGAQARATEPTSSGSKYWSLLEGFKAHQHFFGYHLAASWRRRVIALVEGPFDAMHLAQIGVPALGLHGLYMSDQKAAKLRLLDPPLVVVLLDPDTAGVTAAERVNYILSQNGFNATITHLGLDPKHYDVDSLRHEAPELFPDLN